MGLMSSTAVAPSARRPFARFGQGDHRHVLPDVRKHASGKPKVDQRGKILPCALLAWAGKTLISALLHPVGPAEEGEAGAARSANS